MLGSVLSRQEQRFPIIEHLPLLPREAQPVVNGLLVHFDLVDLEGLGWIMSDGDYSSPHLRDLSPASLLRDCGLSWHP